MVIWNEFLDYSEKEFLLEFMENPWIQEEIFEGIFATNLGCEPWG